MAEIGDTQGKPILIYDLDETLVHCFDPCDKSVKHLDPKYLVNIHGESEDIVTAAVNLRPFALECLRQTASRFHIGIFTASNKEYADAIIDQVVDPNNELIKFRLYRHNCH
jgi:TFIIF-interacting CTD phosphatase-like protein